MRRAETRRGHRFLAVAAAGALAAWGAGCGGGESPPDTRGLPTTDWSTNGGSFSNERYSPLTEIDASNVGGLKGVWHTRLKGSGIAAKYSGEAQPIVKDGVMYVVTGADDVFAMDVATGKIRWEYRAGLDQKIDTVCCGWTNRGVAIGDGRVYLGQLDGKLVALDIATGQKAWETQVAKWQEGYTITSAPLFYDGTVVTGLSGADLGARGRVTAFDAATGKEKWKFFTTPGPGEFGNETWTGDSWKRGGGTVWQTPAYDPELGLLFFSTGNAGPDLDGSVREGDNLFTASIVAIDAKTGTYRWHFQQVHHDIWDYDGPSPVVLYDYEHEGRTIHAIAEASKTGWLYMLDRETGKPIHGIDEKPVKQLAAQKTAKTQPIPSTPPFISHEITDADFNTIVELVKKNAKGGPVPKVTRATEMYEPFSKDVHVVTPGPAGGVNWPPASYNRETKMVYVCSSDSVVGLQFNEPSVYKAGDFYVGSVFTLPGYGASKGVLAAINVTDGSIAWTKQWSDPCYSGTVTTAGNLVFVGRNSGELQAFDATTGDQKWAFQTGAGANSTATVFEHDGKERIAFYSAGNSLVGSAHGDHVWMFGLDGTLGPVAAGGQEAAGQHGGQGTVTGTADAGKPVFSENCSGCHGMDGTGANGGPDLTSIPATKDPTKVATQVTNGGNGMPAFKGQLTEQQIADVAEYVAKVVNK